MFNHHNNTQRIFLWGESANHLTTNRDVINILIQRLTGSIYQSVLFHGGQIDGLLSIYLCGEKIQIKKLDTNTKLNLSSIFFLKMDTDILNKSLLSQSIKLREAGSLTLEDTRM